MARSDLTLLLLLLLLLLINLQPFCRTLVSFSVSESYTPSIGPPGREISPLQGPYLHTGQHNCRINVRRGTETRGSVVVDALCYKSEGRGFET
jgi:hypothetical protein